MSDTPRTDAARLRPSGEWVDINFARRLERELARVTAERDEARRVACSAYAAKGRDLATERGWDCFKEVKP